MKKYAFYIGALLVMLSLVLFVPFRDKLKENRVAAAASPLSSSSALLQAASESSITEGDPFEVPYIKNGEVFQKHLKIDDYAGISDSVISAMQCLKDSYADPAAYYDSNAKLILKTFGVGDKDVFVTMASLIQAPPSYAVVSDVVKKNGYFYVLYELFDKDNKSLLILEANHLFLNNRYAASEYRAKLKPH